jgi:sugar phosphate isomerase/epimerase
MSFVLACSSRVLGAKLEAAVEFAIDNGFEGIELNLDFARLPVAPRALNRLKQKLENFSFKIHAPTTDVELGHKDPEIREASLRYLQHYLNLVSQIGGTHVTVHLAAKSIAETELSFDGAIQSLSSLVRYGSERGVTVCLENLKHGWTTNPELFNSILLQTGAAATIDIGHLRATPIIRDQILTPIQFLQSIKADILTTHVYELETPDGIHHPPSDLANLKDILSFLADRGCKWFVIELPDCQSTLNTLDLLKQYRKEMR